MPIIRRWTRLGFAGQLVVLLSTTLVIIAGLVIAVVALSTASTVGACVNTVLGTRAQVGVPDPYLNRVLDSDPAAKHKRAPDAIVTDTDAQRAFVVAVNDLFDPTRDRAAAIREMRTVSRHVKAVLTTDDAYRADHPLGKC